MNMTAVNAIKKKQYAAIIHSQEYKQLLSEMSSRIVSKSKTAPNEATIEGYFDSELFSFYREVFSPLGFEYNPVKEASIATQRHVTKGRADSAIGALVVEFKQPSTLSNSKQQAKAVNQISDYMLGLPSELGSVGFVTDGTKCCFVTRIENHTDSTAFDTLSAAQLDRFVQCAIGLNLKALNSKNLVEGFCNPPENDGIAFQLVQTLFQNLSAAMIPKTQMLFNEWKELFRLAHDDVSKQQAIIDRKRSLEELLNAEFRENDEEYTALFALQTAYAIIVKLVAFRILSITRYKESLIDFDSLISADSEAMRQYLVTLEEGALFRDYGITNLLEGDFFSWYTTKDQWTDNIAVTISNVFRMLSLYTDKAVLNSGAKSSDFFKELYQAMIPAAVRHSLGEYYTKKWLARQVVEDALNQLNTKGWKGLDPCCGSGTFITVMIDKVLEEVKDKSKTEQLHEVLSRVKGIDLNPVASLTARVNYFINIAHLMENDDELEIPIYLGDSSYVPLKCEYDGVNCLEYTINTLKSPIEILVPESMVRDTFEFSKTMTEIEGPIRALDVESVYKKLEALVNPSDLTDNIVQKMKQLSAGLVELERNHWNGIWARIITNYLTTANLGKFDIIVGNPPWVDWKSLPSGYREKVKSLCISRKLFSGDRVTGGINLNICALISNVAAENWLSDHGILGFLMPDTLIVQPSYEGFRNFYLSDDSRLYFRKFVDWNRAGRPFFPVTQKFLTYYVSREVFDYTNGIDVACFVLNRGDNIDGYEELSIEDHFTVEHRVAATCHDTKNMFTCGASREQLRNYRLIAGDSYYTGREGIEFYPQEMTIFTESGFSSTKTCTSLRNIQVKKSKYHVPRNLELLETEFLHPLIKGVDISPFHVDVSGYIVPFPYDEEQDTRLPIPMIELTKRAPKLAAFYQKHKELILAQTQYNERIIGRSGEFYALARVGAYSFANHYVAFRDNTKWGAAVVSFIDTKWGGLKRPQFQNHAVSICEDGEGNFISLDEAHFICGIMNTPIAFDYVRESSDSRSYPIRPRIYIPKFDASNAIHQMIVGLSKEAHEVYDNPERIRRIMQRLNALYLTLARQRQ